VLKPGITDLGAIEVEILKLGEFPDLLKGIVRNCGILQMQLGQHPQLTEITRRSIRNPAAGNIKPCEVTLDRDQQLDLGIIETLRHVNGIYREILGVLCKLHDERS